MNYRKMRFVENLILLMFPFSVLVACTTNGTDQTERLTSAEDTLSIVRSKNSIFRVDENDLRFSKALVEQDPNVDEDMTWSVGESSEDKYVIVSPSMHLAIYKTSKSIQQDMSESVQTADLKESNAVIFPPKSVFRFDSGVYNINAEDLNALQEHAKFLRDNPQFNLTVNGHTDRTGSAKYNLVLSVQRAQLVKEILTTYGAPESQIMVDGYGESVPVSSAENLDENRRVELEYSPALMISGM